MAAVWIAQDQRLGRPVALKILYPHLAESPDFLERFRREALAAAGLHHANIVQVYDSGFDQGNYFIVMEYLRGGSLRSLITRRRLSLEESSAVGLATARALHFAHSQGIIHRDIKPANILLSAEGAPKVADFGIAKAAEEPEITGTRDVIGTMAYLSPEQLRGHPPIPASDVYALGVVLYELLTGERPFAAASGVTDALARLEEPAPDPRATNPELPAELALLVRQAMEPDPAKRIASADDVASRISPFTNGLREIQLSLPTEQPPDNDATAPRTGGRVASPEHRLRPGQTLVAPGPPVDLADREARSVANSKTSRVATAEKFGRAAKALEPKRRARRLLRSLIVLIVIASLALAGFLVGRRLVQEGRLPALPFQKTPGAQVIEINSFDPQGDGTENESRSRFAKDGDVSTLWSTERYQTPELGGLKDGVGIRFRFDRKATCESVTVHATSGGWSGEVRVSDHPSTSADAYRTVGRITDASADQTVKTGSASGEYWLLWFTVLPAAQGGYRLDITEVDFGVCG